LGAGLCDYIIGDPIVAPRAHAAWYDEQIVHLPDAYQINDRQRTRPASPGRRKDHGLADDHVVYCNFNGVSKITPDTFEQWLRILQRTPKSLLWLLSGSATVKQNLQRACEQHGVDGARIVFAGQLPYAEHIARYHHADIFLDTAPYNAHTTCSEALWLGCPVITCLGDAFPGRVAASLLHAAGLEDLIATSPAAYEDLAVRLAQDAARRRTIRERLRKEGARLPLFDAPRQVRHLEAAYSEMWRIFSAGEAPRAITVSA
jgi:predicted O-linked N-acetylglucosamine transferase (SPINDLY family)